MIPENIRLGMTPSIIVNWPPSYWLLRTRTGQRAIRSKIKTPINLCYSCQLFKVDCEGDKAYSFTAIHIGYHKMQIKCDYYKSKSQSQADLERKKLKQIINRPNRSIERGVG